MNIYEYIRTCTQSCFTGQLVINFNGGHVCQPLYMKEKKESFSINSSFCGKMVFTYRNGKTNPIIKEEEIWIKREEKR